jgi:hypothetical protein
LKHSKKLDLVELNANANTIIGEKVKNKQPVEIPSKIFLNKI